MGTIEQTHVTGINTRNFYDASDVQEYTKLRNMIQAPSLTHEETMRLIQDYQKTKNVAIRNKIVVDNLRLALVLANKCKRMQGNYRQTVEDLYSIGVTGLIHAIELFDISKNVRFSTYATYWIYQYIKRAQAVQSSIVYQPVYIADFIQKIHGVCAVIESQHIIPTVDLVAEELAVDRSIVAELWYLVQGDLSLDAQFESVSDGESTLLSLLVSDDDVEFDVENNVVAEIIQNTLKMSLTEREYSVIVRRYGLCGHSAETLEEIAKTYNLTRERIRQIEKRALKKLTSNCKLRALHSS